MEFIEAPVFTKLLADYLDDDGYRELQLHLAHDPEAGDVIPGTGGFRKVRWADRRRHKGKRGVDDTQIWLMTLYDKGTTTDLSPAEKRFLKAAIEKETQERASRRARGRK